MQKLIEIGGVHVGIGRPVFVIAEAGVNHNGDPDLARRLIEKAAATGAQCVKFQTFKSERVAVSEAPKAAYQLKTTDPEESQLDMLRKLELPVESYAGLLAYAESRGIVMISTPYNTEDVDFLDEIGVPAFKLASLHVAEPYFLQYVARKGKPMILSTGMATLDEVAVAVKAIERAGNDQLILLQCTTNYPSRIEDTNLKAMNTMEKAFDTLVGYSDHTTTDTACIGAVALGACIIEKHFTLDRSMPGPDHEASADSVAFTRLVQHIREAETMIGTGEKVPCDAERKNTVGMRRSIYARSAIRKGQIITPEMLIFKRPATGLAPVLMDRLLGQRARYDIAPDQPLSLDIIAALST